MIGLGVCFDLGAGSSMLFRGVVLVFDWSFRDWSFVFGERRKEGLEWGATDVSDW